MNRPLPVVALMVAAAASAAWADDTADAWAKFSRARAEKLERIGAFAVDDAVEEWLALGRIAPHDVVGPAHAGLLAVEAPVVRGKELAPGSKPYKLAEACLRDGVARGGDCDPALAYVNGRIWFAQGNWSAAAKWFARAEEWGFEPVKVRYWRYRAVVNRALPLVEAGRASEAADQLKALLAEQPGHPEEHTLFVNLATALWRIQDVKSATKILEDVIAKSPGGADTYLVLGMILADQGDFAGAKKRLQEAMLHASASYGDKTYRDALLRLSDVEIKLADLDGAEAAAKQFLALSKDDPEGLVALGTVMQARHDLDGAVRNFRHAARLQSESMNTLVRLKQVLSQLHEDAEAEDVGRRIDELVRRREQELRDEGATPTFSQAPGDDAAKPSSGQGPSDEGAKPSSR